MASLLESDNFLDDEPDVEETSKDTYGPPEIRPDELQLKQKIGQGVFGQVFKGTCRGKEVAVKKFFQQDIDDKQLEDFKNEVNVMSQLRHQNVLLLMGACMQKGEIALVMEFVPRGSLEDILHDKDTKLTQLQRLRMAKDVALGMNWLHCSKPVIVHRDLKPANLLADENLVIKVADFGLSSVRQEGYMLKDEKLRGTPLWMAPEVLKGELLDERSDIYSFAICFWEMLTSEMPFSHFVDFDTFKRAVTEQHERPPVPKGSSPKLAALLDACWAADPRKRPMFAEIIKQLDEIVLGEAVKDKAGLAFWSASFEGKDKVTWKSFLKGFAKLLPGNIASYTLEINCLKLLLAANYPNGVRYVTLENWGRFLDNFGPLDAKNATPLLDRVRTTLREPWFHGDIDKDEANSRLCNADKGTYLVRLSTTQSGMFTISKVSKKGKVQHQRVEYQPNVGFSVKIEDKHGNAQTVTSNESLGSFLKANRKALGLDAAAPGSKFSVLFKTKHDPSNGYI